MKVRSGRLLMLASVLAGIALLAPAGAGAATVVNGDFEAGSLSGWAVYRTSEAGSWFAYKELLKREKDKGETHTGDPIADQRGRKLPQPPPQGRYAATSDQLSATTTILSQEVALAPGLNHRLSLLAYYDSEVPIGVPSPDTLSVDDGLLGGQRNQQFRIDVMRPGSPIESLNPADVLSTAFRTGPGAPTSMGPTWVSADLSAFAGQTVRLRIADAAHEELFTAGVDAVAIDSARPGERLPPLGSNRFKFGKLKLNRKNGTATLAVKVPGPGKLRAKGKLIKQTTAKAAKAGTTKLRLKPTASGRKILEKEHELRAKVAVTFDPVGGSPRTKSKTVVFKFAPR
jgi:hypothetical protein